MRKRVVAQGGGVATVWGALVGPLFGSFLGSLGAVTPPFLLGLASFSFLFLFCHMTNSLGMVRYIAQNQSPNAFLFPSGTASLRRVART